MSTQRIILANDSRLVREMLARAFVKAENLTVVREISDCETLPIAIKQSEADWVIMSLRSDSSIPSWVDSYIDEHPSVRFIAVSPDGSRLKMKWLECHEEELNNLSLEELIHLLEQNPQMVN